MKANKAKNSATQKSGELKCSLSSKGTEVSLAKVKTKCHFTNVAEYILDNRIRSYTSLQAIALIPSQEGEKELFGFLARNTSKSAQEPIEHVWSMHGAAEKENWDMGNGYKLHVKYFPGTVSTNLPLVLPLVNSWRRATRNVYFFVGPSNCGKRFHLEALEQIFNCFTNPAQGNMSEQD